ncbi:MAG: poly-gamma-glutamate system protein [Bacteroidota bacterium]
MKRLSLNIRLLIIFLIFFTGFLVSEFVFVYYKNRKNEKQMLQAVELTKEWFNVVQKEKEARNIFSDASSNVPHNYLIGNDFTLTTTTLGSIQAKEISTNPDFAALMVRLIKEAKIKKGDKVGVIISGSFPSLAISTLAALQTLKLDVILMSSLGASSYGANQPGASWLDIETWLIKKGNLNYKSVLVSRGAENDIGLGLSDEGVQLFQDAASRNKRKLFSPLNISQAINERVKIFSSNNISLLINIGGNQAALGKCVHSVSIPNGLNKNIQLCDDKDRGVIQEINAMGTPVINLLNIKELANKYGMDISPGIQYVKSLKLFKETKKSKLVLSITLIISLLSFMILKIK